ncbi:uracil-DNA glycosylase [Sulfurimonas sp. HSL-3221]|uniref:uracil-DNA glycosylase n=1 Tax=Sulfurimonadaceae TaxID=2771471 RepID=UPI001E4DE42C|nr:uracil-DNA glycosylase [Sulfurimonas sp. HSL-3221]UFS61919.1 uracil-DNA glycosylase [Sulfurimonas sp. HSL-3221]
MQIDPKIDPSWKQVLSSEFEQPYFKELKTFLLAEKAAFPIYPKGADIFAAFNLTPYEKVKVVILGQDPYHGPNQAHGLAFSVQRGIAHPPSLQNIFKELREDIGCEVPQHGTLEAWAQQGVFLLNTVLTVRAGQAHSHKEQGWERFTDATIKALSDGREKLVFILWGRPAQMKASLIDASRHHIITSPHPSPLSAYRGFFGSKPFSQTNAYLQSVGIIPIDWCLNDA